MSAVIGFSFTCVNCEKKSEASSPSRGGNGGSAEVFNVNRQEHPKTQTPKKVVSENKVKRQEKKHKKGGHSPKKIKTPTPSRRGKY